MKRPVEVKALKGYRVWLRYDDGRSGEVDVSDLSGAGNSPEGRSLRVNFLDKLKNWIRPPSIFHSLLIVVGSFAVSLTQTSLVAGTSKKAQGATSAIQQDVAQPVAVAPFDLYNNRVYVPAQIDGAGPFSLILDTGASAYWCERGYEVDFVIKAGSSPFPTSATHVQLQPRDIIEVPRVERPERGLSRQGEGGDGQVDLPSSRPGDPLVQIRSQSRLEVAERQG